MKRTTDLPPPAPAHGMTARARRARSSCTTGLTVAPAGAPVPVRARVAPGGPGATTLDGDPLDGTPPEHAAIDAAFTAVYHAEFVGLVRLAYLILGSREQAEEVVQDAFVRLHGRWRRVDNPGGYLRTSVINGCRDIRRRLVRYRAREPRLAVRAETWDAPDELSDALAALPLRQRSVLVLRFYGNLTEAEIAAALGIRPGTVKSSLHRGLDRLRRELS